MGSSYLIVNPDREEYLDPVVLLQSDRLPGALDGLVARAVLLLTLRGAGPAGHPLAGRWCTDTVLLAGDGDGPDLHEVPTSVPERPDRNLFLLAEEGYRNLSLDVLVLLAEVDRALRQAWAGRLPDDPELFARLGAAAVACPGSILDPLLRNAVGPAWPARARALLGAGGVLARHLNRAAG